MHTNCNFSFIYIFFKSADDKLHYFSLSTIVIIIYKIISQPSTHARDYFTQIHAPCTHAPCTHAPCTHAPCTHAPCTHAPCTHAPCTHAPCTHAPCTHVPCTHAPRYCTHPHAPCAHKNVKSLLWCRSLPVENLLPQNVGSIINYLQ